MNWAGLREAVAAGDVYIVGADDAVLAQLIDIAEAAQMLMDGPGGQPGLNNGRRLEQAIKGKAKP